MSTNIEKHFTPVKRAAASDEVMRQLLELMIAGRIRPKDRLPTESELATRIGVGRNSVREAMKVLDALGLVERRQGDGTYIVESYSMPFQWLLFPLISQIGTSNDLVELRRVLEIGVTELVVEKATNEELEGLENRTFEFARIGSIKPFPREQAVAADVDIHVELARITGNPALVELSKLIMKLFEPSMGAHISTTAGFREAVEDHEEFVQALKARDIAVARSRIMRSFESWKRFIEV